MSTRVAVIGAGISGIAAANVLRKSGFEAVVFEKAEQMGGVWAVAYPGIHLQNIASQYYLSDFPWPVQPDLHPSGAQILHYLDQAVEHLELDVRLKHEVLALEELAQGWRVRYRNQERHASGELRLCDRFRRPIHRWQIQATLPRAGSIQRRDHHRTRSEIHGRFQRQTSCHRGFRQERPGHGYHGRHQEQGSPSHFSHAALDRARMDFGCSLYACIVQPFRQHNDDQLGTSYCHGTFFTSASQFCSEQLLGFHLLHFPEADSTVGREAGSSGKRAPANRSP